MCVCVCVCDCVAQASHHVFYKSPKLGHSLDHDLKALSLVHPRSHTRDTAHYKPLCPHRPKALKALMKEVSLSIHLLCQSACVYIYENEMWKRVNGFALYCTFLY